MQVVGNIDCMVECESSMPSDKGNYSYHLTDRGSVTVCTSILTWQGMLVWCILPLDVDSINENDSVANPDPTPRIASVHKSRFAEVVLVGCWIEAVYYGLLLFTIT